MGLMSVFLIGLAGKETMFIKFSCSQTFSRYSKKHSGFICVYFFLFGQLFFFSVCLFLVLCFLILLKHYHQINLPKVKFLFLIASQKPGWFLTAHVMNFWILHVTFIWSVFLVPGTLLSDLPYSPNLISHSSPLSRLCSPDRFCTAQETIPSCCS